MRKFRFLIASAGAIGLIGALGACSSSSKTGDDASVTVDGKPVELTSKVVACTESAGKVLIAIGDKAGGIAGAVGATVTTGDNPEAESVGLGITNGQALGWTKGAPGGDVKVSKHDKHYTISGTVTGVDPANPMAPAQKPFEIKVTCP
ncbi:MAG: lipoprotein LpqH [Gordonia sp. (in: high G+C Gram-positive bacteria)]|uniref:lipoprotein LpqH n=1 Tax=Gordonia sp. (in: high G+C Gram-positive bacteria) TaxID=84139 RepID=UPI0039E6493F